jgi:hypothetical protein
VKAKLREDRTDACQINGSMRPGRWTSSTTRIATGRRSACLRLLTFSRFSPAVDPYRGEDVALTPLIGAPAGKSKPRKSSAQAGLDLGGPQNKARL